jgi:hypothetical protein
MRRLLLTVGIAAASVGAWLPGVASAAPASPGDTRNCGDFGTWNEANVWFETYQPFYGDVARIDTNGDLNPCETLPGAPTSSPPASSSGGYWMVEGNGSVFGFGDARPLAPVVRADVVASAGSRSGGYWLLSGDGTVQTRGEPNFGNASIRFLDQASAISALPDGSGYWVFTRGGAVQAFGAAKTYGDMASVQLNGQIVGSAVTPSGHGYWMVGSDGGIFSFGDAAFSGSTGDIRLNQPVVGIAADPDGLGYWLVAADGGIFAFDASFRGSVPAALGPNGHLNRPVIGALAYGNGYLMVASDGGIFAFSDQPFFGSLGATPPPNPIVAVAVRPSPLTPSQSSGGGAASGPDQPTTPVALTAAQVGPGTVQVSWPLGVTPTKLSRNGADGGWDTDRDSFGGVPQGSLVSHTFQFTALAPGPYNFTMTYTDSNGVAQTTSTDAVQVFASTSDPATPGAPSAVGRVQSARLLFGAVTGDVKEYQWNATVSACCGPPTGLPPTGWHTVPADHVLNLRSYGSSGSGHFSFQIRACNSADVCGTPSGFSESITVYRPPYTPTATATPSVSGGTVTWNWFAQVGFGIAKPETYTPTIDYFVATLDGVELGQHIAATSTGQYGSVLGTYSHTFARDGQAHTLSVYSVATVDGQRYTGQSDSFTSPPVAP